MFVIMFLLETTVGGRNLLLGFMPEPVGLLIFGAILTASSIGLRRIFDREKEKD